MARSTVTPHQRAYLWGVVYVALVEAAGAEPEDWHEYALGEFGGWEVIELFGLKRRKPKMRSSDMTRFNFSNFVDFIRERAKLHGVEIPAPDIGEPPF